MKEITFNDLTQAYHDKGFEWVEEQYRICKIAYENALQLNKHYATDYSQTPEQGKWDWRSK